MGWPSYTRIWGNMCIVLLYIINSGLHVYIIYFRIFCRIIARIRDVTDAVDMLFISCCTFTRETQGTKYLTFRLLKVCILFLPQTEFCSRELGERIVFDITQLERMPVKFVYLVYLFLSVLFLWTACTFPFEGKENNLWIWRIVKLEWHGCAFLICAHLPILFVYF